jgi:hypothetical protein
MRSPGRGRGGTGARASAFREGVVTIPVVGLTDEAFRATLRTPLRRSRSQHLKWR